MDKIVIVIATQKIYAWQCHYGAAPKALRIQGEDNGLAVKDAALVLHATKDLADRLADNAPDYAWVWVLDAEAQSLLNAQIDALIATIPNPKGWEIRQFQPLAALAQPLPAQCRAEHYQRQLLPVLLADGLPDLYNAHKRQQEAEIAQSLEDWQQQRAQLQQTITTLTLQRDALRRIDIELMVAYMPALFKEFFTTIQPLELAMLCGHITPPQIPNPYPEPNPEFIRHQQRKLSALPEHTRAEIIQFAKNLPQLQKLQLRPEMRSLWD